MQSVSVIVTAYNVERYIRGTVQSILAQTLRDIEIIVVNDGSTDRTQTILESLCRSDDRITLINKDNGGVSSARNCGLEKATGEYILFVDGDDLLMPAACESLHRGAVEAAADIVVSDYMERNEESGAESRRTGGEFIALDGRDFGRLLLRPFFSVAIWNKLVRRRLYRDEGIRFPIGISMAEDFVTLFELTCRARSVVKLDEPTIVYVNREGSLVRTFSPHVDTVTLAMDRLDQLIRQHYGDSSEMREEFRTLCYYSVIYARVIHGRTYGSVHRKMYDWYRAKKFESGGPIPAQFMSRRPVAERLVACGYRRGYLAGVALSRAIDLARAVIPRPGRKRVPAAPR